MYKRQAPEGVKVYNPAFDVTDHELIAGIVTEYGVARAPYTEKMCIRDRVNEVYSAEVDADGNVVKSAQEVMLAAAQKMAATIAKNAPIAVRNCKKAINDGLDADMDQAVVIEEKLFGDCFETEDQKYGMAFFLDKNKEKVKEPFQNK